MKKYLAFAAAAATVATAPAMAQGTATVGGPRVEATVGWDRAVAKVAGESSGKSGVTFGGEAGYDLAVSPSVILGAYVGVDGASTKECAATGTEELCLKAGRNITIGARVGTPLGANSLFYFKGGYSNGRVKADYTDSAVPADNFSTGENMDGFHLGTGVQVGLTDRVYGKAEYNYTRYSTYDAADYSARFDRHRLLVGVGIGF